MPSGMLFSSYIMKYAKRAAGGRSPAFFEKQMIFSKYFTSISKCDITVISRYDTSKRDKGVPMDKHIERVYVPMTETAFYILFSLQEERHGYGIGQRIQELTEGRIAIGAGTMYGTLSKMEKDGLIRFTTEKEKRKYYLITDLGREVLELEKERIRHLYRIVQEDQA